MLLNIHNFLRAIPAIKRAYIPGSRRNSGKTMRLSPCREMRPDPLAWRREKFHVPSQTGMESEVLDGTPEFPQEHSHKSRGTMRSPQQ